MRSDQTSPADDLPRMVKKMGKGLLVTEVMGQGVNYVTGDYSRGVFGYWVENGEIQFPVEEITIASNMKDMLLGIEAIGADQICRGTKTTGSILMDGMMIAGGLAMPTVLPFLSVGTASTAQPKPVKPSVQ
jgi:PmbA protein